MKKRIALALFVLASALGAVLSFSTSSDATLPLWRGGGDLSDASTMVSQTVTGLQGKPLPAPSVGFLASDGGAWYYASGGGVSPGLAGQALFTNDAGAATVWAYPHGDVDASAADPGKLTVNAIQGFGVSTSVPSTGNTLGWNGSLWVPSALNLAGGSGYVTGSLPLANTAACGAGTFVVGGASNTCSTLDTFDSTHGRITAGGSGSDALTTIGPLVSNETLYSALYLLPNGTSRTAANAAMYGDGANALVLNTPGANPIFYLRGANTTFATWDASTPTAPVLASATGASSFTLGTTAAGAALELQGDFASNVAKLTTSFEHQTFFDVDQVTAPAAPASGKIRFYTDAADGKYKAIDPSGNIFVLVP